MKKTSIRFLLLAQLLVLLGAGRSIAANADLVARLSASESPVTQGSNVTMTATFSNAGPQSASAVLASVHLPGFVVTQSSSSQGSLSNIPDGVACSVAGLQANGTVIVTVNGFFASSTNEVEATSVTNRAEVVAAENDPNPANNIALLPVIVIVPLDFGDAPGAYLSCLPGGARHRSVPNYRLGALIDAEGNCQPNDNLAGVIDEDGVAFFPPPPWLPGAVVTATVTFVRGGNPAVLDLWVDTDTARGSFDPLDHLIVAAAMGVSPQNFNFAVPLAAAAGPTWVRTRMSQAGTPGPGGYAPQGEVEDYPVGIRQQANLVAAMSATPTNVPVGSNVTFSVTVTNAGPDTASNVVISLTLPGFTVIQASASSGSLQPVTNGLQCSLPQMTTDGGGWTALVSGSFDSIAGNLEYQSVSNRIEVSAQEADPVPVNNVALVIVVVAQLRDFGDAPAPPYPTLLPNGARHSPSGLYFGALRDLEANGAPTALADGDNVAGVNDEDGIVFMTPLNVGRMANIQITASLGGRVDAWMDFNADGDWRDAGEQILISVPLPPGVSAIPIAIPARAVVGPTYARFRISAGGGLTPMGFCAGGEVEDYRVNLTLPPPPPPTQMALTSSNGKMVVSWNRPGTLLQQADHPAGPWETLPTAPNPFVVEPESAARFFRVVEGRAFDPHELGQINFGWMAQEASLIVDAVVSNVQYRNSSSNQADQVSWPHTFVTLDILETLKGRTTDTNVTLRCLGGVDEFDPAVVMKAARATLFDVGERSILLVTRNGHYPCPLVSWSDGRFRVIGGLVYTDRGRPLVTRPDGSIGFGSSVELTEIRENLVGTNVVRRIKGQSDAEQPRQPSLPGQPLTVAQFKSFLQQQIVKWNPPQDLQSPVLTPSLSPAFPFSIPKPVAGRPANPPAVPAPTPIGVPNPVEQAALQANGGNPVLP